MIIFSACGILPQKTRTLPDIDGRYKTDISSVELNITGSASDNIVVEAEDTNPAERLEVSEIRYTEKILSFFVRTPSTKAMVKIRFEISEGEPLGNGEIFDGERRTKVSFRKKQ